MNKRPTVLVSICQGFQERLLLGSGVVDKLRSSGARVVIACPNADESEMRDRYAGHTELVSYHPRPARPQSIYYTGRRLLLWKHSIDGAQLNFQNHLRKKYPWLLLLVQSARHSPWSWRLAFDRLAMRSAAARQLLTSLEPDLVVMASPGFQYPEAILLNEACRRGLRTAVVGQSWDNFSTKGYVSPKPDLMICWGDRMREEAIGLQEFSPDRTIVCGAPHFDRYHDLSRFGSRRQVLERLGLDPARQLIVYGTSPRVHAQDEFDIVKRLAEWVQASPEHGPFRQPLQLLIRLHPQQVIGAYSQDLASYQSLMGLRVQLDIPKMTQSKADWQMDPSEYERLPLILSHADVVVNCFSTFAIDAVAAGKPVICAVFDGDQVRDEKSSARRYLTYTHLKGMTSTGGVRVVSDYAGLQEELNAYLADPGRDAAGREALIRMQVYRVDGRSAERTATALADLAGCPSSSHQEPESELMCGVAA